MLEWNEIAIRLGLAILCGGLVGFERERNDWAVGIRTHMLACMGSALVMMVSSFGFADILGNPNVMLDPSRVASSVIIGIGYLGAGIILILKPGNIKGLTTASALWATAAIGLACGGGLYFMAGIATVSMLAILYAMQEVQRKLSLTSERHVLTLRVNDSAKVTGVVDNISALPVKLLSFKVKKKPGYSLIVAVLVSDGNVEFSDLIKPLNGFPEINSISWS